MLANAFMLNIILFFLYSTSCLGDNEKEATSGPYKSRMYKITTCESPSRPYLKDSPINITVEMYNSSNNTLLRGNFTVLKDVANVNHKSKGYIWENNKWKTYYMLSEFDCHTMLLHFMYSAIKIKYDRKTCKFSKGNYYFKDIDVNSIQHMWSYNFNYGKVYYRYELLDPKLGTYFCYNFYMITVPDNK